MSNTRKNILVIDDDKSICWLLERLLGKDFNVVTQTSGLKAMKWLNAGNKPDLIISDINMPQLSGGVFVENLKKSGLWKEIPVVMLSGYDDEKEKEKALAAGAISFYQKPFNPEVFIKEIHDLTGNNKIGNYA
ncbi:response regulator [Marinigracilibium pacificum]|uniref:Response regulator n=1 Tax=Marinigracilibium pacificum TaxID=2729599 RepID=A0A848IVI7_9BACT|nr:response regulator [Marinigracilibium pacificum]NMM47251.1 response regulator [Marinigracilibium pacificum]